MSKSNEVLLILGDQLYSNRHIPTGKKCPVLMIEDYGLCTHFKYHKNKITYFLTSMREHRDQLINSGFKVHYYDSNHELFRKSFEKKLDDFIDKNILINEINFFEINDIFFRLRMDQWAKKRKIKMIEHPNPMFLTGKKQFKEYLKKSKYPKMMNFYNNQRKRLNILVDENGEPSGGKWSFDTENRKKYPKNISIPRVPEHKPCKNLEEVREIVGKEFYDHPGTSENFWLPVNRKQALEWLDCFLNEKFQKFGPYEDAIKSDDVFGFHSVLSPMLNNGLLTPNEVIEKVVEFYKLKNIPIASVEGYIRQIIGWREFVKGIYDNYNEKMEKDNFWGHTRKMQETWYSGTTGLLPFDDSVSRLQKYGYTHHIERLMIQSSLMLLSELDPKEVYRWFMEMYVDSADWVMAANVYGMGQMSEGGVFATKPYICGSNYILKMSDYKKGDWCETMDGLYWRFIAKNKKFFSSNPRMSMMSKIVEKLKPERRERIFEKAEQFIKDNTY